MDKNQAKHDSILRKQWKKAAKGRLKKFYFLFVILCLISGFLGVEYAFSVSNLKNLISGTQNRRGETQIAMVLYDVISGNEEEGAAKAEQYREEKKQTKETIGVIAIEHSEGVFAEITNMVSSGQIVSDIFESIMSVTRTKSAAVIIMVFVALAVTITFKVFISETYHVTYTRLFLEGRIYEKISSESLAYLVRKKSWFRVSMTMLRKTVYQILWSVTIVGGLIKTYSYLLVPYIIAENPDITGKDAILLSRRMMDGHKKEAFVLRMSFVGWYLLNALTMGLVGILFVNPYTEAVFAEYYTYVRELARTKNIPGSELLGDRYLYQYATDKSLRDAYSDVRDILVAAEKPIIQRTGIRGVLENVFGVTLFYDEKEKEYEYIMNCRAIAAEYNDILNKKMYPRRLHHNENRKVRQPQQMHYNRHYTVVSIIFLFFSVCILGWLWEVSIHLVEDGVFVNRGVLHGPWLPIYGAGSVLILLVLNKLRNRPKAEFVATIVLCGIVEYVTSWVLEVLNDGMKWWDYSGYFININGRICAEGLLVFGLGGIAVVYFVAPFLDNIFRKLPKKTATVMAIVLASMFLVDMVYSFQNPNSGAGITDYAKIELIQLQVTGSNVYRQINM